MNAAKAQVRQPVVPFSRTRGIRPRIGRRDYNMKRALIALFAFCMMSALSAFAADKGSWTGYIADEKCGAKAAAPGQEACTKKCIESGAKAVFVTDDKKEVIPIHNQDAVKGMKATTSRSAAHWTTMSCTWTKWKCWHPPKRPATRRSTPTESGRSALHKEGGRTARPHFWGERRLRKSGRAGSAEWAAEKFPLGVESRSLAAWSLLGMTQTRA